MKLSRRKILLGILIGAVGLPLLGIASFIIWRMQLASDVKRQLAAIRSAGLPTNGAEANNYYPAVPDPENAALKMASAFELMTNYNDQRSNKVVSIKFPPHKAALTPEQLELLAPYCAMNSNALAAVDDAIELPHCRYPVDLSWGAGTLLPHLAGLRSLSRISAFESLLDPSQSSVAIPRILGLAHTLDKEPVLISKLVRIAILSTAVAALERRLNTGSIGEAELRHLNELFAGAAGTNQMVNGLIGERAMYLQYFRMSWAEINRLADSEGEAGPENSGPPLPGPQPFIFKCSGFFERDLRFYLDAMDTNISIAGELPINFSTITNVEDQISRTGRRNYFILSSMLLPALGSAIIKEASSLAEVQTAQTALAVERFRLAHGELPDNLEALVPQFLSFVPEDPFDGQPLRYHRLAKGYVIYSVGRDGHDNGGRERPANTKSSDKTEYDITFAVER